MLIACYCKYSQSRIVRTSEVHGQMLENIVCVNKTNNFQFVIVIINAVVYETSAWISVISAVLPQSCYTHVNCVVL